MGRRRGFSWKRTLGISAAKGRLSRQIGIPLTHSGRRKKLVRALGPLGPILYSGTRRKSARSPQKRGTARPKAAPASRQKKGVNSCGVYAIIAIVGFPAFLIWLGAHTDTAAPNTQDAPPTVSTPIVVDSVPARQPIVADPTNDLIQNGYVHHVTDTGKMPDVHVTNDFLSLPERQQEELLLPLLRHHFDEGSGYLRIVTFPGGENYGTFSWGGFNVRTQRE